MNPHTDAADHAARLRRARRRQARRLVAAVGAIVAAVLLVLAVVDLATAPNMLAERTFRPPSGDRIAVRVVERGDRITGRVEVVGPDLRMPMSMRIDFTGDPGRSRRARIDYDANASRVLIEVDDARIAVNIARRPGVAGFRPVFLSRPQSRPAP